MADVLKSPAILLIGGIELISIPIALRGSIRNNVRLNGARLYIINSLSDQTLPAGETIRPGAEWM